MKLLICGSREFVKLGLIPAMGLVGYGFDLLNIKKQDVELVIHGGAGGIDIAAGQWAGREGIPVKVVRPDYRNNPPRQAPIIRNREMVREADVVLAVWDGGSSGTEATILFAHAMKKKVVVVTLDWRIYTPLPDGATLQEGPYGGIL